MLASAQAPMIKASWLWDTPLIRTSASDIIQYCRHHAVNAIYLQINRNLNASDYAAFIRRATDAGIAVHALDGKPTWGFVANRTAIDRSFQWLEAYQAAAARSERFAGIHVDIEPYALPYWNETGSDFIAQWQSNVRYIVRKAKRLRLPIAANIPYWLSRYLTPNGTETLSRWMMRQYKAVTVLANRDTALAISDMAAVVLAEAAELNVPATVGIETAYTAEGGGLSYREEGTAGTDECLIEAVPLLNRHGSFAGIAIYDDKAWSGTER